MEGLVSEAIVNRFFQKLRTNLRVDVVIVGGGPSALVAAKYAADAGLKVVVLERRLAPGGGVWGGGMLFNEVVVQKDSCPILDDFSIRHAAVGGDLFSVDAVEMASGLIFGAVRSGAVVFNAVSVEDIVFKEGKVQGVVIQWTPVQRLEMHVDPIVITARAVLDATGHPSEIVGMAARKAGIRLDTETGGIVGEKPMWAESGEVSTVENTGCLFPGLYASGMAANNVKGGYRMGPIFGGMLKSGQKVAGLLVRDLHG